MEDRPCGRGTFPCAITAGDAMRASTWGIGDSSSASWRCFLLIHLAHAFAFMRKRLTESGGARSKLSMSREREECKQAGCKYERVFIGRDGLVYIRTASSFVHDGVEHICNGSGSDVIVSKASGWYRASPVHAVTSCHIWSRSHTLQSRWRTC